MNRLITSRQARENFAEVLNKVAYGGDRFIFTRHGNEVAVLISLDEWKLIEYLLEKLEEEEDIKDADAAFKRIKKEGGISLRKLKKDLNVQGHRRQRSR